MHLTKRNLGRSLEGEVTAVCIAVDRCEVGADEKTSAIQAFQEKYNIPVISIVNAYEVKEFLSGKIVDFETKTGIIKKDVPFDEGLNILMEAYLEQYGVKK